MKEILNIAPLHTQGEVMVRVTTEKKFEFNAVRKSGEVESFSTGFVNSSDQKNQVISTIKKIGSKSKNDYFVYVYFNLIIKKEFFLPNNTKPFHVINTVKPHPIIYLLQPSDETLGKIKVMSTEQVKRIRKWSNYHLYGKYHIVQIKDKQVDDCWSIDKNITDLAPIKTISIAG